MRGDRHEYGATVIWQRGDREVFLDGKYSRGHAWRFDGGAIVPASSSPNVVPKPMSIPENVDPEEAFVASIASCHMLFFLFHAARGGFVVDRYEDAAVGVIGKNEEGRVAMLSVTLRPRIAFSGNKVPSTSELSAIHEKSHHDCFIANSVKTKIAIEQV
jgi:organic hydroperoxide reductase OsmC/OhrA